VVVARAVVLDASSSFVVVVAPAVVSTVSRVSTDVDSTSERALGAPSSAQPAASAALITSATTPERLERRPVDDPVPMRTVMVAGW
jgi:hypothetical protein